MLLSIDTCGPLGTIALARFENDESEILGQTEIPGKTYSAQLVPAIREILHHHKVALAQIATIIVTNGPGSFTGIRIGLSTAKGLAEAHAIPVVAVSRLAVLAQKAQASGAALDASRHEFYFGDYSGPRAEESLLTPEEFQQRAALLAGNLAVCEGSLHPLAPAATLVSPPAAADAIRFALPRFRARVFDEPTTLDGNYLRRSDAEIFSKPKIQRAQP